MNKFYKQMTLLIVIMFTIPMVAMLCCCIELPVLGKASSSHYSNDHSHGKTAEHHHDGKDNKSTHSHEECNHAKILGSLADPTVLTFKEVSSPVISLFASFKSGSFQELFTVSNSPPLETGPPGHSFSPIPLYLEISVLRI